MEKRNYGGFVKVLRYWFGIETEIAKWWCWYFICKRHFASDNIEYTSKFFFNVFLDISFTGSYCTTVNPLRGGEIPIASYGYPRFINFLKPFRKLIIVAFLGKGREEVEVGGWEMITLHLGSKETSLSCN